MTPIIKDFERSGIPDPEIFKVDLSRSPRGQLKWIVKAMRDALRFPYHIKMVRE